MVQFVNKAGLVFTTNDKDKIEAYKAKGLKELKTEPQPNQEEVKIESDYVVRKVATKPTKKGAKRGG